MTSGMWCWKDDYTRSFTKMFIVCKRGWPISSLPHFPRQGNQDNVNNGDFNIPNCQGGTYYAIGGTDKYQAGCWKDTHVIGTVEGYQAGGHPKEGFRWIFVQFLLSASKKPYVPPAGVSSTNLETHMASLKVTVPSRQAERRLQLRSVSLWLPLAAVLNLCNDCDSLI